VECKKEEEQEDGEICIIKELPSSYSAFNIRVTTLKSFSLGGHVYIHEDCKFAQNAYRKKGKI